MKKIYSQTYPGLMAELARQGITLTELAKMLGMHIQKLQRRLSGQTAWGIEDIEAICNILNKNYYELFTKQG